MHACENNNLKCQLLSSVGNRVKQQLMNQFVTCECFLKKADIATDIQLKVKRNISKQMHDLMLYKCLKQIFKSHGLTGWATSTYRVSVNVLS